MRKILLAGAMALGLMLAWLVPAAAQSNNILIVASCGTQTWQASLTNLGILTEDTTGKLCVNATVNATVGGFQGNGSFANLTATASTSASTALPTGTSTRITNASSTATVSCTEATGAATAVVSNIVIPPLSSVSRVNGSFDHIACINQTGSTGSNLVVLEGGSGLGNDSGGGGGSGGGSSGAVFGPTAVGSAAANPPVLTGGTADGTATGAVAVSTIKAGNTAAVGDKAVVVADPNLLQAANSGVITNGSAPPGTSIAVGAVASGATGGLGQPVKQCDQTATYDASTNGSTLLKAGVSGRKFYICGFVITTGGTATNVKLVEGTTVSTACDTGTANVTPAFQLAANDKVGANAAFWNGLATATAADNLCINASAGNAVQAIVWFTIQ